MYYIIQEEVQGIQFCCYCFTRYPTVMITTLLLSQYKSFDRNFNLKHGSSVSEYMAEMVITQKLTV